MLKTCFKCVCVCMNYFVDLNFNDIYRMTLLKKNYDFATNLDAWIPNMYYTRYF